MSLYKQLSEDISLISNLDGHFSFDELIDSFLEMLSNAVTHKIDGTVGVFQANKYLRKYGLQSIIDRGNLNSDILNSLISLIGFSHQMKRDCEGLESSLNLGKVNIAPTSLRKLNGIYYTDFNLARLITRDVVSVRNKWWYLA